MVVGAIGFPLGRRNLFMALVRCTFVGWTVALTGFGRRSCGRSALNAFSFDFVPRPLNLRHRHQRHAGAERVRDGHGQEAAAVPGHPGAWGVLVERNGDILSCAGRERGRVPPRRGRMFLHGRSHSAGFIGSPAVLIPSIPATNGVQVCKMILKIDDVIKPSDYE